MSGMEHIASSLDWCLEPLYYDIILFILPFPFAFFIPFIHSSHCTTLYTSHSSI
jgi:hypothetical protein